MPNPIDEPIPAIIEQRRILPALVVGDILVPDSAWYSLMHNYFRIDLKKGFQSSEIATEAAIADHEGGMAFALLGVA
jgi:hypothetical protein